MHNSPSHNARQQEIWDVPVQRSHGGVVQVEGDLSELHCETGGGHWGDPSHLVDRIYYFVVAYPLDDFAVQKNYYKDHCRMNYSVLCHNHLDHSDDALMFHLENSLWGHAVGLAGLDGQI